MEKINDLIIKRLLRKINVDEEKVKSSLKTAKIKLKKSKKLFKHAFYNESIINAYTALFHSYRALLYRDGMLVNSFYHYQLDRHAILYGIKDAEESKEESKNAIITAELFIKKVKEFLKY